MEKQLNSSTGETIIDRYKKILKLNSGSNKKPELAYDFSQEQWMSFAELANDLELNDQGIKILFQEVNSGRLLLPCDRNKKVSH